MSVISATILRYLQITVLSTLVLYFGKTLFIPLFFGLLIAIILYPVCRWLENKKCTKTFAISISMLILFSASGLLIWILILEARTFQNDLPSLIGKVELLLSDISLWLNENWKVTIDTQNNWLSNFIFNISKNICGCS
ncbi:AI-2E family transporter [Solitalea canadensis]|uniref:AI-2E family transporter n=1 Tax=Solitalea canadensis TaxID=995 RepID=UPI00024726A9